MPINCYDIYSGLPKIQPFYMYLIGLPLYIKIVILLMTPSLTDHIRPYTITFKWSGLIQPYIIYIEMRPYTYSILRKA